MVPPTRLVRSSPLGASGFDWKDLEVRVHSCECQHCSCHFMVLLVVAVSQRIALFVAGRHFAVPKLGQDSRSEGGGTCLCWRRLGIRIGSAACCPYMMHHSLHLEVLHSRQQNEIWSFGRLKKFCSGRTGHAQVLRQPIVDARIFLTIKSFPDYFMLQQMSTQNKNHQTRKFRWDKEYSGFLIHVSQGTTRHKGRILVLLHFAKLRRAGPATCH